NGRGGDDLRIRVPVGTVVYLEAEAGEPGDRPPWHQDRDSDGDDDVETIYVFEDELGDDDAPDEAEGAEADEGEADEGEADEAETEADEADGEAEAESASEATVSAAARSADLVPDEPSLIRPHEEASSPAAADER